MSLDSKMRPGNDLRQRVQRVSIEQACNGWNGCARAGASHLLSIDTDEDFDALSKQGVV